MKKKTWDYLRTSDIVDIIAPASHVEEAKLIQGMEWIRSLGLVPRVHTNLIKPDVFFAAPLDDQFDMLKEALHSDSKAIWCLRGGYGCMRLIPLLENISPPEKVKLLIGFSDITALHLYFNQKWGWPTLHGRTISQLSMDLAETEDRLQLRDILLGNIDEIAFHKLLPLNEAARENKTIHGEIIGGNLRLLQTSLGTSWEMNAKDKILFIEDVGERGYSVDRMLEQLHQSSHINEGLKALVIGDFTEGLEKNGEDLVPFALKRFAQRVPYPVVSGLPCGHGKETNFTLPFLTKAELSLGEVVQLKCSIR